MVSHRVLFLGPAADTPFVASELGPGFEVLHATEASGVDAVIRSCDAVLDGTMRVRFDKERLSRAERLRLFTTATTGADHIDSTALGARGIPLLTLRDAKEFLREITPAAEHSWLLLMACARKLPAASAAVRRGEWDRTKYPGRLLKGATLGVVGCGRLGQWMARYAGAFGLHVLGYDPFVTPWPEGIQRTELHDLLSRSDFVTVHVHLDDSTRRLLGPMEFEIMKPGAVLVNTSRGDIIDEDALLAALRSGRLAAAGLDVLSGEPQIDGHPLIAYARTHDNLVITPHIAGFAPQAFQKVVSFTCGRIRAWFDERA